MILPNDTEWNEAKAKEKDEGLFYYRVTNGSNVEKIKIYNPSCAKLVAKRTCQKLVVLGPVNKQEE